MTCDKKCENLMITGGRIKFPGDQVVLRRFCSGAARWGDTVGIVVDSAQCLVQEVYGVRMRGTLQI